ncbi:unnamed protein product [Boreogadus saida]
MTPTAGAPRSGSRRPPRCQRLLDCTVPYRSPGQRRGTGSALRSTSPFPEIPSDQAPDVEPRASPVTAFPSSPSPFPARSPSSGSPLCLLPSVSSLANPVSLCPWLALSPQLWLTSQTCGQPGQGRAAALSLVQGRLMRQRSLCRVVSHHARLITDAASPLAAGADPPHQPGCSVPLTTSLAAPDPPVALRWARSPPAAAAVGWGCYRTALANELS